MVNGQKVKIISLVNETPLKFGEIYEGEYYYGYSQHFLRSIKYEGYKVMVGGINYNYDVNKFIPLAEYRDVQLNKLLEI